MKKSNILPAPVNQDIIIYKTDDGKASIALMSADGMVWLNQMQMAQLFATSKQTISYHINNILKDNELSKDSVVKEILTTASDGNGSIERTRG